MIIIEQQHFAMNNSLTFGAWLKQRRRQLDLTQEELARKALCSASTIRKIEADDLAPSQELAQLLATALDIPAADQPAFIAFARAVAFLAEPPTFATETPVAPPVPAVATRLPALPVTASSITPATFISPPAPVTPRQYRLPAQLTPLIGREWEVTLGKELICRNGIRLVTLSGAPGTGKTRLALAIAEAVQPNFSSGVCFVSLASISDPALVPSALAQALGVRISADQPVLTTVQEFLQEQALLLVLDNFEQVISAADLMVELLQGAPLLKILVTSRALLKVYGEQEFPVPPLTLPATKSLPTVDELLLYSAVALFVQRAQAVQPAFQVTTANAAVVVQICTWLDGLPLAIEMAAARCKLYPPATLLAQLRQRLTTLNSNLRNLPPRQQTLHNAIDWSYNLLAPVEQQLFNRLGVFVGGCTAAAFAAVSGNETAAALLEEQLQALVDQSLLQLHVSDDEVSRYTLLQIVHEYAVAQLTATAEWDSVQQRHAAYYLALAQRAHIEFSTNHNPAWFTRVQTDHDNCRAVLQRFVDGQAIAATTAFHLVDALSAFWHQVGYLTEGVAWCKAVLQRRADVAPSLQARVLRQFVRFLNSQGEWIEALGVAEEALALVRTAAGSEGVVDTIYLLGYISLKNQEYTQAQRYLEEGLARASQGGYDHITQSILLRLSELLLIKGDYEQAIRHYTSSLQLAQRAGDRAAMSRAHNGLGDVARLQGDYGLAVYHFTESLALARPHGGPLTLSSILHNLAYACFHQGDLRQAAQLFAESLSLSQTVGDKMGQIYCIAGVAAITAALQQWEVASQLCSAAQHLLAVNGIYFDLAEQIDYQQTRALLQTQVDKATFVAAWAAGQKLSLSAAVALALAVAGGG